MESRRKLEAHRELTFEIEKRHGGTAGMSTLESETAHYSTSQAYGLLSRAERYQQDWDAFADLAISALGCGLSRVATLAFDDIPPEAYAHQLTLKFTTSTNTRATRFPTIDRGRKGTWRLKRNIKRNIYQSKRVARLLQRLREIPEGSGSMLDNTLVVCGGLGQWEPRDGVLPCIGFW